MTPTHARGVRLQALGLKFELDTPPQRLKALLEGAPFGIAKAMP
jgi:hypothetical protein